MSWVRPKGGKRWLLGRVAMMMVALTGIPLSWGFFIVKEYAQAAGMGIATVSAFSLAFGVYSGSETIRPHSYGGDIVINQNSKEEHSEKNEPPA